MLGDQPWGPPDTYDTFNTGARLDYTFSPTWSAFAAASLSHSLIQDNVIYAYGCYIRRRDARNCPNAPNAPAYFFAPTAPTTSTTIATPANCASTREAEAMVTGHIKTGAITQDLAAGGELFLRSVQQPGFYTVAQSLRSQRHCAGWRGLHLRRLGKHLPAARRRYPIESPLESAGPRRLWEDSHQSSAIIAGPHPSSRPHSTHRRRPLRFAARPQLLGLRIVHRFHRSRCLRTRANRQACLAAAVRRHLQPGRATLRSTRTTACMLSLGPQAPFWVDNGSQFLAPFFTRQAEVGAKYEPGQRILLTARFFHMRAPFFYPKAIAGAGQLLPAACKRRRSLLRVGRPRNPQRHRAQRRGQGRQLAAAERFRRGHERHLHDTGTPSFDNKQVINVPHLHTTRLRRSDACRTLHGLHLMPGWSYTTRKEATRDDAVSVPSYNLFNLGARYTPGGEQGRVTFRIYADNITDKRYWSDTGASYGDTFIWLGAPTTVRLSAHYTF